MDERRLTSLIFGNVVLESHLMGTHIRVYSKDLHSYYMHSDPNVELSVPLNELRAKGISVDHAEKLSKSIFDSFSKELEETYPGGAQRAQEEFVRWLLGEAAIETSEENHPSCPFNNS
ncbi:hypothetical protein EML15_04375 [Corynebacterium sp. sy017]|uniref:hypothetical protein n=1 Tax=unclassified Corynebacterium TaxID=2624378 RepID=UPI001185FA12|nr:MULTISPECIES: hypothetical protein [unclassified Corynebacterium]MBP3088383.1 hypothetical protein [Corynebacterium sp. sy017]TSD91698.1 hypothetical protein ELY17_04375 [Corynebacterium sp. SY003]